MSQEVFRRNRGCGRWAMKTDENVERVRTLVRTDRRLGMRKTAEELNMDKETVRRILTTNWNMKNVCAKMVLKNPPVFSHKINTNARTRSVIPRSCPMWHFIFQNVKRLLKRTPIFSQLVTFIRKRQNLKSTFTNGFRRWMLRDMKARMAQCVASDGNYFEGVTCMYNNFVSKVLFNQYRYLIATPHSTFKPASFEILIYSTYIIIFPYHSVVYNICCSNNVVKQPKNQSVMLNTDLKFCHELRTKWPTWTMRGGDSDFGHPATKYFIVKNRRIAEKPQLE
jgi:hypothetical protein